MLCKNEIMMSIFRRLSTNPAEKLIFRKRKTSTSTHIQVVFRLTFKDLRFRFECIAHHCFGFIDWQGLDYHIKCNTAPKKERHCVRFVLE